MTVMPSRLKTGFLFATILAGIFLLAPYLDFQLFIAQGDHGRDLYCFKATLDGQTPYRDYWWVYGPLMPYYYSLFFKFLGVEIPSILLGKMVLNLFSGIFFYLALAIFTPPLLAFTATLWLWVYAPDFFYTYNHAGGMTAILAATYLIFLYIKKPKIVYLKWALLSIFLLCLIKINFGLATLVIFLCSVAATDWTYKRPLTSDKKLLYIVAAVVLPAVVFLIYYLLLKDLPIYAIRQCLPYLSADHPHHSTLQDSIKAIMNLMHQTMKLSWGDLIFGGLVFLAVIQSVLLLLKKNGRAANRPVLLALILLIALQIVYFHEFAASGVFYTTFWVKPASMLFMFLVIAFAVKNLPRTIHYLLAVTIIAIVSLKFMAEIGFINLVKSPFQYLDIKRTHVFVSNEPSWVQTVKHTTAFLNKNLKEDETFLALPYDPLYYYLADRQSPTRQLIFFEHINIPPVQEEEIIAEIKRQNVEYVILSNRSRSTQRGLGILGKTYCPLLGDYIFANYKEVVNFGPVKADPGWATQHGVTILKRLDESN